MADIDGILHELTDKHIYISDGHHRYDTALNYRNERCKATGSYTGEEGFNFTAMFLAQMEDSELTILPAHRALFPRRFGR
jgi:uncharacterized protein (DUF1015 family)